MNAKKIMGAVLVALLAAALFVGAGAAAEKDLGTVFVYQNTTYTGTWTGDAGSVTFVNGVISGDNIKEGKYSTGNESIYVEYPTAAISAVANASSTFYNVIGSTLYYNTDLTVNVSLEAASNISVVDILLTYPDGTQLRVFQDILPLAMTYPVGIITGGNALEGTVDVYLDNGNLTKVLNAATGAVQNGEYKAQAVFGKNGTQLNGANVPAEWQLLQSTPDSYLVATDVYTFNVVKGKVAITAAADSAIEGEVIKLTVTGIPGSALDLNWTKGNAVTIVSAAPNKINDDGKFIMPNDGKIVIQVKVAEAGDVTFSIGDVEVTVTIAEGAITAAADAEAYYIGNDVTITGTSTAGNTVWFYIAGTNIPFQYLNETGKDPTAAVQNGEFEYEIDGKVFQKLDAGTYTVYVTNNDTLLDTKNLNTYTTVSLVLKQPFISVTEAPSVAVQGADYVVKGTAEATDVVAYYIFGTNYFAFNNDSVTVKDGKFTIEIKGTTTEDLAAGQYFMVVQHKMYDGLFNAWAEISASEKDVYTAVTKETGILGNKQLLFDVADRQKANAAQALCDALDSQNIDDMYVKLSFVVAAPTYVINPIPETVAQGEKLTVSGSTNVGAGKVVTVEMLSTAFAAVPKETVGSAAFVALTTKTDENGNWEVTFDTSGLNVDEYTVSAAVEQLGTATAKVNVVEAAPEQPDQPDVPGDEPGDEPSDEPVAPETPGFGALAALAGLGAVAVLLLRRE